MIWVRLITVARRYDFLIRALGLVGGRVAIGGALIIHLMRARYEWDTQEELQAVMRCLTPYHEDDKSLNSGNTAVLIARPRDSLAKEIDKPSPFSASTAGSRRGCRNDKK